MSRIVLAVVISAIFALGQSAAAGAPKKEKRAYKPAEKRQQQEAAAQQSAPDAGYELELQAAKDKRDKDLADAAATESNRRTLEKRKQEIFSQYAAIVAAIRDKYQAAHGQDPADAPTDPPASSRKPGKTGRQKNPPADPEQPADDGASQGRDRNRKSKSVDALAAAQAKLDEENHRHQAKLAQLNGQLQQAEEAGNQREVRRVQKAIEKENNTYDAKRTILERRVQDAGGTPTPGAQ